MTCAVCARVGSEPHRPGSWHAHGCGCHDCDRWRRWIEAHRDAYVTAADHEEEAR